MLFRLCRASVVLWLCTATPMTSGQDAAGEDTAAIKAAIQSYVRAFNARDAQKLVSHWSPEGIYTSRTSGQQFVGHAAIGEEFAALFAAESTPQLAVTTESIEFISPNVAVERGGATVTRAADDVQETSYSVVYVKRDGTWLIDRVTEDEIVVNISHHENLKDLEWLIGEWSDQGDGFTIEVSCQWTSNQNFISRTYAVSNAEEIESTGLQIIGWDPNQEQIRSWLFDAEGSVVTGTWTPRDDRWIVQSVATLAGGGTGSFTSIFRPLDEGSYAWQKINRVADGRLLPNIEEIVVQRK